MSGQFPWFKFSIIATGLMGAGYALMKATVPTEEQTYNALAPDLRRKVDANRAARLARENATEQQVTAQAQANQSEDPDKAKPIWADTRRSA